MLETLTRPDPPTLTEEPPVGDDHPTTALVNAARQGDRAAFGALHERFAPMVHGLLLSRVPVQDADDLVQDVFLHAMRKLSSLRQPDAFGPWLATITRNFAVGFHRIRHRPERLGEGGSHRHGHDDGADLDGAARSLAQRALNAIRDLPEAYRETLILRLVEGLTGPQIAACTGLTSGSVRINLHRGMKLLRANLDLPEGDTP